MFCNYYCLGFGGNAGGQLFVLPLLDALYVLSKVLCGVPALARSGSSYRWGQTGSELILGALTGTSVSVYR